MKRRYTAPPDDQRCVVTIQLRGVKPPEFARCMKRARIGNLCLQHATIAAGGVTVVDRKTKPPSTTDGAALGAGKEVK